MDKTLKKIQLRIRPGKRICASCQGTQYAVDETAGSRQFEAMSHFDALVNRGPLGNAVKVKHLVSADTQNSQHRRLNFSERFFTTPGQGEIKMSPAAENSVNQLRNQSPVARVQIAATGQSSVQGKIGKSPRLHAAEDLKGKKAGIIVRFQRIFSPNDCLQGD
jgi:hypothetical protein